MKQFLSIIIVVSTVLLPSVSWGSVDGKGLYCEISTVEHYGVQFLNGEVKHFEFRVRDDKFVWFNTVTYNEYRTSTDTINWSNKFFKLTLDRKSLNLKSVYIKQYESDQPYERIDKCEVYSSEKFKVFIEGLREDYQKWYDKQIKDKKI